MSDDATGLTRLNGMSHDDALAGFLQCCTASAWAEEMTRLRPYRDEHALFETAERVWREGGAGAWRAAFDGHPRIGEKEPRPVASVDGGRAASDAERRWSQAEQAAASMASSDTRAQLAAAQRDYENRFGHIFLICATGRSADDILAALRTRMNNDPDTELRVAAHEQAAITRLRLEKLLSS